MSRFNFFQGHTEKRVLREELDAKYPQELADEVRERLPARNDSTLLRYQRKVLGPNPTSRMDFDPTHVLSFITGGEKILVLDSEKDLGETWSETDIGALVTSLRKQRPGTDQIGSETSSQVYIIYVL